MRARLVAVAALVAGALSGLARAQDLNVITAVEVRNEGGTIVLSVKGSKAPNFTTFSMADPPRFVIDLSESRFEGVPEDVVVQDGVVNVVKNLSYGSAATSIARIMIAFQVEVEPPDVQTSGSTLLVRVARPGAPPAPAVAAAPPPPEPAAQAAPAAEAAPAAGAPSSGAPAAAAAGGAAVGAGAAAAAADSDRQAREQAEAQARADEQRKAEEAAAAAAAVKVEEDRRAREAADAQARAKAAADDQARLEAEAVAREQAEARARDEAEARRVAEAKQAPAAAPAAAAGAVAAREEPPPPPPPPEPVATAPAPTPAPTARLEAGAPSAQLREVGFRQLSGVSRVFVRTNVTPRFSVQDVGQNTIRVELENTRVDRRNDTRFLDTSFFSSAVAMITPSRRGSTYVVDIKLRERVPYQQRIEGDMVALDFERPARAAAPAAAEAPAGEAPAQDTGPAPGSRGGDAPAVPEGAAPAQDAPPATPR